MVALLNLFNTDFKDFIESLHKFDVAYFLIGGYAVVLHGYIRTTGDLGKSNKRKLMKSFSFFGLPTNVIRLDQFLKNDRYQVFFVWKTPYGYP
ncbi:hypothetical protein SAMN05192553_10281 [Cyclobacterium xiamenense]|uniref:Uncharacterized protein n=1 Tax=Cyclobacterium xiamenense TaxID=1297121 RepID=A0A1H6VHP2_9BACT|nr:hypothetical protein SAMN05192553_10281 [Cyclobacterium xiamenense]